MTVLEAVRPLEKLEEVRTLLRGAAGDGHLGLGNGHHHLVPSHPQAPVVVLPRQAEETSTTQMIQFAVKKHLDKMYELLNKRS